MNYFIELKLIDEAGSVKIRPEVVAAVERNTELGYDTVVTSYGERYDVERGQFALNCLTNHTGHAGLRVLG